MRVGVEAPLTPLAYVMAGLIETLLQRKQLSVFCATWNLAGKAPPSDLTLLFRPAGEAHVEAAAPWRPSHHVYAIGSEECERGILASMLVPGAEEKLIWEAALQRTLGAEYVLLASQALGATHLAVWVHTGLRKLVSDVKCGGVATGFGNALRNKGGVAVGLHVGATSLLFVNCHLAAGQGATQRRNADWARIDACLGLTSSTQALEDRMAAASSATWAEGPEEEEREREEEEEEEEEQQQQQEVVEQEREAASSSSATAAAAPVPASSAAAPSSSSPSHQQPLASHSYDRVVWMGDLNYRLGAGKPPKGSRTPRGPVEGGGLTPTPTLAALPSWDRAALDAMLEEVQAASSSSSASSSSREAALARLVEGDQLLHEQAAGRVAVGFTEGPLTFLPTYKLDKGTDRYDTGPKRRLPAYTDRILYRCREGAQAGAAPGAEPGMQLCSYRSVPGLRSSDHRAVVAEFVYSLGGHRRRSSASSSSSMAAAAAAAVAAATGVAVAEGSGGGAGASAGGSSAGGGSAGGGEGPAHGIAVAAAARGSGGSEGGAAAPSEAGALPPLPRVSRARAASMAASNAAAAATAAASGVATPAPAAAAAAAASQPPPVATLQAAPQGESGGATAAAAPQPPSSFLGMCFGFIARLFSSSGKKSSAKVAPL